MFLETDTHSISGFKTKAPSFLTDIEQLETPFRVNSLKISSTTNIKSQVNYLGKPIFGYIFLNIILGI